MVLRILLRNCSRHPLRGVFILPAVAVAILSLGPLPTIIDARYAGVRASEATLVLPIEGNAVIAAQSGWSRSPSGTAGSSAAR